VVAALDSRGENMIAERIEDLELMEGWYEDDPTMRVKVNFPFFLGTGTKNTAVVYFDIEPGYSSGPTPTVLRRSSWSSKERPRSLWGTKIAGFLRGRWHLCRPWCRTACVTWAKRLCG
jgi:hypothetical protein